MQNPPPLLLGVDFSSSPSRRKPIVMARGERAGTRVHLRSLETFETLDALGRCSVVVGGDTGLVHLAAACGARPVVVFGPTHPRDGYFAYAGGSAVQLELACRPCTRHRATRCRTGHHGCVDVDVRSVVEAVWGER